MRTPMHTLWRALAVVLLATLLLLAGTGATLAQDAVVRFYLFYSETCPHCEDLIADYLPTVYEKYGDQVEYEYLNIYNDTDLYLTMLGLEKKMGVPDDEQGAVPALVIGDTVLIGGLDIPEKLEGYIDEYLAAGGVDFPSLEDLPEVVIPTPEPAVQVLVFFDPDGSDFERINTLMVSLGQKHGAGLQAYPVDLTVPENSGLVTQLNGAFSVQPSPGTTEVVVGRELLVGMDDIETRLPGLVDSGLAQGGILIPPWEELLEPAPAEAPTAEPSGKAIYVAYFEQAGCQECARASYDLALVQDRYPQVEVESFSMEEAGAKTLNEWLSEEYGVPEEKRLSTPMLFIGEDVLVGEEASLDNVLVLVEKYAATGSERTWEDFDSQQAEQSLVDRFKSFGLLTVLGAGLIDGLNPCAFATLIFFISYLAFTGRRGRDILFVGISFALGVFLTYLLVGVGLLKVVQSLSFFTALGRWVYLLTAVLCVVLAVLTFRDFYRARKGATGDMTLKLPMNLRRRINKVIREGSQVRGFVAMAFVTGFVVSLLELACTGQVYLPTIMFVLSVPELAGKAFLYLFLYCVMFILPLIVVFVLSYFGTTSEQLGSFINRHTSTIKFVTGLVFIALSLWMTWTVAPLFGIYPPWNFVLMGAVLVFIVAAVVVLLLTGKQSPGKTVARRRRSRA